MTIAQLIQLCKKYLPSMAAVSAIFLVLGLGVGFLAKQSMAYTATAVSHMEVSAADDYDPNNTFNHVTRSQLAYQKMNNYEALYSSDQILEKALAATKGKYELEDLREAVTVTTDPDHLTETVEVTLPKAKDAATVANTIVDEVAAEIARIEGDNTFVVTNIAPADPETALPSGKSPTRLAALGLIGGLVLAFLQALYRQANDKRLFQAFQAEEATQLPVLAVVPEDEGRNEAIRHIRAVLFSSREASPVTALASARKAEDSVSMCSELASICAAAGKTTIVVDANEAAALTGRYGLESASGLTDGTFEALKPAAGVAEGDDIRVLPVGSRPERASDVVLSHDYETALESLAKEADIVLVDYGTGTPTAQAGHTILVAVYGTTTTDELERCAQACRLANVPNPCIVLDKADFSSKAVFRFGDPGQMSSISA